MRLNIENCAKNGEPGHKEWALEELVRNLKEMRDRSNAGDMAAAVTKFFEVFRFNDGKGIEAVEKSAIALQAEQAEPGFVMVPVEPTETMISAGFKHVYHPTMENDMEHVWGAMVAARPSEPPKPSTEKSSVVEPVGELPKRLSEACEWSLEDEDNGIWQSSCGELWSFTDGGPKENRVSFCHHCGKPAIVRAAAALAGDTGTGEAAK